MTLTSPTRYKTALEYTYDVVKRQILDGTLKPGARIDQDQLAAAIGVSRVPVRAALERLASQGLVTLIPQRGAVVAPMSREELLDLYAIREHLEPWAVRLAQPRLTAADHRRLADLLEAGRQAVEAGDLLRYLELNREFHQTIHRAAGNAVLVPLLAQLWDRALRYRLAYVRLGGRGAESLQSNAEFLACLERGTADEAAEMMRRILVHARERLLVFFDSEILLDPAQSAPPSAGGPRP